MKCGMPGILSWEVFCEMTIVRGAEGDISASALMGRCIARIEMMTTLAQLRFGKTIFLPT